MSVKDYYTNNQNKLYIVILNAVKNPLKKNRYFAALNMTKCKIYWYNNKGVTLVELASSIAIIGLLIAAIASGINIQKSSEIRSFMADIAAFQVAIEGFNSKYNDWPGDMSDALSYWSSTSNGNSDGRIELGSGGTASESYRAWQQLSLAGLMGGSYSGIASGAQADIGINVPASKRTAVGYNIVYANTGDGFRNEISIGKFYSSNVNTNPALTTSEAFAIDKKMDDGIPQTGSVHGINGHDSSTCTSGSGSTSFYQVSVKNYSCIQTFQAKP